MPEEKDFLDRTWVKMFLPVRGIIEKIMIGIDPDKESVAVVRVSNEQDSEAMVKIMGEDAARTFRTFLNAPELKPYHMAILCVKEDKAFVIYRLYTNYEPAFIDRKTIEEELKIDLSRARFPIIVPLKLKGFPAEGKFEARSPPFYI